MLGKYYYPAIFLKEEKGYTVTFPDFEYLVTCGDSEFEAFEKAEECLGMGISDYIMHGKQPPKPSSLVDIHLQDQMYLVVVTVHMGEWMKKYESKWLEENYHND